MIQFKNVSLQYGHHAALKNVNFQLPKGSFTVLEGHSGAGKSSILRLLATFEKPTKGDIWVGQSSIAQLNRRARAFYRRSVGYTGFDVGLLAHRTCFENVALPLRIVGLSDFDIHGRVKAALARVGLSHTDNMYPTELSGGQQLRLQIARAVVNRPALVLADEPTAQLDPDAAYRVVSLLEEFHHAGVTIMVATHEVGRFTQATHHLKLAEGQILPVAEYPNGTKDKSHLGNSAKKFPQHFIQTHYNTPY